MLIRDQDVRITSFAFRSVPGATDSFTLCLTTDSDTELISTAPVSRGTFIGFVRKESYGLSSLHFGAGIHERQRKRTLTSDTLEFVEPKRTPDNISCEAIVFALRDTAAIEPNDADDDGDDDGDDDVKPTDSALKRQRRATQFFRHDEVSTTTTTPSTAEQQRRVVVWIACNPAVNVDVVQILDGTCVDVDVTHIHCCRASVCRRWLGYRGYGTIDR